MTEEEIQAMQQALEEAQAEVQRHLETIGAGEARVQELESALAEHQTTTASREDEIASLKEQMASAATKYRALVLAGSPEIPQELVSGATIEEVEASLAQAKGMVERVKRQLEAQVTAERIPTGAPARTLPDLSGLSPREKIAYALARQ